MRWLKAIYMLLKVMLFNACIFLFTPIILFIGKDNYLLGVMSGRQKLIDELYHLDLISEEYRDKLERELYK